MPQQTRAAEAPQHQPVHVDKPEPPHQPLTVADAAPAQATDSSASDGETGSMPKQTEQMLIDVA